MNLGIRWKWIDSADEWLLLAFELFVISVVSAVIVSMAVICALCCAVQAVISWNPRYLSDLFDD